jgi:site-specific DNA recombinase
MADLAKLRNIRCAIYTRKSSDEGLDQEFNSLDAQREAAEAFILSQRGQGFVALAGRYDDGGFSGSNTDRPALQRLLTDVRSGGLDCVLVYKVDRLSRSLADFARIVEILEEHKVSLVSVTQQFNTTSSFGRLTLNILLSFAQFEREIIAERTRDKMSAARRKGKWTGGHPVLGYDICPQRKQLVVNGAEADRVREIFAFYIGCKSLLSVVRKLDSVGWCTKRWVTSAGNARGGKPFTKSQLYRLLTNSIYTGRVAYKGEIYGGQQEAIVDARTWEEAQYILHRNMRADAQGSRARRLQ